MSTVRVATFNVENLFTRWRFKKDVDPAEANKRGWIVDETMFEELGVDDKAITGAAVRELHADILGLQEVENVDTLKRFRALSLGGRAAYPFVADNGGNDPRLIDVAALATLPILRIRSYQHLMDPQVHSSPLFSRDCLELDVRASDATTLTLYVNHFKSMIPKREETAGKRQRQCAMVKQIITDRFGPQAGDHPFVALGDFNDYVEGDGAQSAIRELVEWDQVENVVARLPSDERWTHYYADEEEYRQLDYVLVSRSLAARSAGLPEIMRKGLPLRATRYTGERFPGVGLKSPKASDHCPVVVELDVP